MYCTRLAQMQDAKTGHLGTVAQLSGYIFATKVYIEYRQSEKNLLNSSISSTCPHNMVNFGPLTTEPVDRFGAPAQISTGFASWFRYCSDVAQRKSTKLCRMFGRLLGWYTVYPGVYTSGGSCPLTAFCHVQNSFCVQVLRSPVLAALLHGTGVVGVSQTLWYGTRNGIMELSLPSFSTEGATHIQRAAITLGIGPHSSYSYS